MSEAPATTTPESESAAPSTTDQNHGHDSSHDSHGHDDHGFAHVMPISTLFGVWAALMVLTGVTVFLATLPLGSWDIWVAMTVATVKATLVCLYFMHLRYEKPFNTILFIFSLIFVALFLGLALLDSNEYQPSIEQHQQDKAAGVLR